MRWKEEEGGEEARKSAGERREGQGASASKVPPFALSRSFDPAARGETARSLRGGRKKRRSRDFSEKWADFFSYPGAGVEKFREWNLVLGGTIYSGS